MSLDKLKLFLAVANTGSFSRAAQVSDVTQSAISKRIFQLELQLGHRLFDRHGRGATLTDAGRVLVRHAESLLRDADQLAQVIGGELAQPQGVVRLAVQASISWPLLQHLYSALQPDYPLIRLQVDGTVLRAAVTAVVQTYHWHRRVGVGYPVQVPRAVKVLPTVAVPEAVGLTVAVARASAITTVLPLQVELQPVAV